MFDVMREEPEAGGSGAPSDGNGKGGANDLIPRSEAVQAFKARDEAKRRVRELEEQGLIRTAEEKAEYEALKADKAKREEERLRKDGEHDKIVQTQAQKYEALLVEERKKAAEAETRLQRTTIGRAFADATEVFGPVGKTIYTARAAEKIFGDRVSLNEAGDVVVTDTNGDVITDLKTGKPLPFAKAMVELLESLPDRNDHLRGSGKTGSGSSGGTGGRVDIDLRNLTPDQRRDPKVLAALRASLPRGGVVMGEAYSD